MFVNCNPTKCRKITVLDSSLRGININYPVLNGSCAVARVLTII